MDSKSNAEPIMIDNLYKRFGDHTVLNGITLHVKHGETVAVLGRSGIGKSVLLKLIIGLQPSDAGSVKIDGQEITSLNFQQLNEVRKRIGFLFQQAALYDSLTVEENVAFPLSRHTNMPVADRAKRVKELLAGVGMEQDLEKMPSEISGGMQKRVGLARALALDPRILLFDEPTAGLDPITAAEIGKLILELKQKRQMTAIVVTHDIRGAKTFSDRMVLIHEGNILADGPLSDLQKSKHPFVIQFLRDSS
ncbi:MAG TPA: ATP-binding cassette domain-containing protein [Bryobacteraceae bacterium]|jgi:phospholipid/cholesterol/gamma-HCH transport system ATP-binding protein|nr:ATP-binding cassette domain-containing protein [Bryobacteraceae bacterium]